MVVDKKFTGSSFSSNELKSYFTIPDKNVPSIRNFESADPVVNTLSRELCDGIIELCPHSDLVAGFDRNLTTDELQEAECDLVQEKERLNSKKVNRPQASLNFNADDSDFPIPSSCLNKKEAVFSLRQRLENLAIVFDLCQRPSNFLYTLDADLVRRSKWLVFA